jgi:hypothetical protein
MLSRDGHPELMQAWHKPEDTHLVTPITREEWLYQQDLDKPLGDVYDGWGWHSHTAALYHWVHPQTGEASDCTNLDPLLRFSSLPFGLSLSMNVDW